ncbi:hypothetical protein SAMN02745866_00399 [Alteromonadaceae bacterium Bs31]|nr:hypothetical protein SAMN02745866_00399 [Alteromonadaceae bacterium Bs31]
MAKCAGNTFGEPQGWGVWRNVQGTHSANPRDGVYDEMCRKQTRQTQVINSPINTAPGAFSGSSK